MECGLQIATGSKRGGGNGESAQVNLVAATGTVARTSERREERSEAVQRNGEEIRAMEAKCYGYVPIPYVPNTVHSPIHKMYG